MACHVSFPKGDAVGFRKSRFGSMAEYLMLQIEGVAKYGAGPFRVKGIVEDRNGIQMHVETETGEDPILPASWFIDWKIHPSNPRRE